MQRLLSYFNKKFRWSSVSPSKALSTRHELLSVGRDEYTTKIYWATQDNVIKWINHYPFYSSCQNLLSIYQVDSDLSNSKFSWYELSITPRCKPLSLRIMTEFVLVTCSSFLLSSCFKKDITSNVSLSEFDIWICRISFSYNKRFALSLSVIKAMVQRVK